jgi:hypothetical protein
LWFQHTRKEKNRKDYTFRRQFNEKPSITLGCPGFSTHNQQPEAEFLRHAAADADGDTQAEVLGQQSNLFCKSICCRCSVLLAGMKHAEAHAQCTQQQWRMCFITSNNAPLRIKELRSSRDLASMHNMQEGYQYLPVTELHEM